MRYSLRRTGMGMLFLALIILCGESTDVSLSLLLRRGVRFFDIAGAMIPPETSYARVVLAPLWATVQMSLAGTGIGAVLGLVGASFANAYLNPHAWLRIPFKTIIHLIRTIPALILALLCTFLVGLGTLAGTLALSIYTTVVMVRMGYEDMENADLRAAQALEAAGCGRLRAFIRAVLPAVLAGYLINVLYMLEANVRHAAILGYVGAGGIGILLNERLAWREYSEVGMILLLLYVVVLLTEGVSEWLRQVLSGRSHLSRMKKVLLLLTLAVLFFSSFQTLVLPDMDGKGMAAAAAIMQGILHPDWSMIFSLAHDGVPWLLYETFCIAFLGTLGGTVIAAWFSFSASFRLLPVPAALASRLILLLIRAVPVFVYGLMWIRVTGPGPFAGVLTLSLCSVGLLAKRFLIAIDDIRLEPYRAYRAMGISVARSIRWAVLPQLVPRYGAAVLYRFDVNLRDAAILGLVGAGGIGTPLILAMMHYEWAAAGALLWGMTGLVTIVEIFSEWLRKKQRLSEIQ
ncbi:MULTISPECIES: ABC transporter permease [Megasphaera]|uniref:ABC transporter permease subunit n=1 Tax=Megasphaera hexanoica TaxID=1675036 RepID=A0A848BVM3_9FIRM|nr:MULTISPECIES: ABC transporter permease subunit [Megasphaera]KUH57184.1 hypothetical protein AT798_08900 [Megasphaera sp. DJF_B143]MCI5531094.1 ABC transporter permease subunit [Caecibacter massiliensis]NME29295.1 ABC transporter permease subunit [Megasphaera hexanoica]HAM04814.1 phosphonate ABC transporter, permease protein PhnE [Megasphaera sp.]